MRLLTYRQAADLLACSQRTIARRVHSGLLTVVIDGGMRRIPERDLDRYVAARTVRPRPGGRSIGVGALTHTKEHVSRPTGRIKRLWEEASALDISSVVQSRPR